ncbi:MAG: HPr(Ser) kinase/phosphatase [Deltaproteobacteria bacterium]|nr:HPr(Ser) kinase/phosphatase [Deltaproteobacteria bacterium]
MPEIQARDLLSDQEHRLGLTLLAGGEGLDNRIRVPRIQKPGLALAGYRSQVRPYRVQVIGATELEYLATLPQEDQDQAVRGLFDLGVACFVVTKGLEPLPVFYEEADRTKTPLFRTSVVSSILIERLTRFLEARLAPVTRIHGVLVDVMELGVLLIGPSGIGKSECAMDLLLRGHRLVADDIVHIRLMPPFRLIGRGEDLVRYHMEIRGVGIVNVRELFGITAVREEQEVELVIEFVPWREGDDYDRLGLDDRRHRILGVEVPHLRIPVGPGRNIASVVELAVRNQLLRKMGFNSAIQLKEKLDGILQEGKD